MGYKIVTPMSLWQNFNPVIEPLEVEIVGIESTEKYIVKELFFTAETVSDGKIRAYARAIIQKNCVAPTVLFVPKADSPIKRGSFIDTLVEHNFNVFVVDYGGFSSQKDKYTSYPKSLEYCNVGDNFQLPYKPTDVQKSSWFTWMKVIRRAMTLALEESNVDKNNLFLFGYVEGAQLCWKVAGIDGRVSAVIPVGACGYTEFFNKHKYDDTPIRQFSDDLECWLTGISTQAYAKMMTCPVYYVAGTNSTYADIDRVGDLFNLISHDKKYMSFSEGTGNSIKYTTFLGAINWAKKVVEQNGNLDIVNPKLKSYVSDGKLYASVTGLKNFKKVDVFYSLDELAPQFRSWVPIKDLVTLNQDEVLAVLVPREDSSKMFVYATVTYNDGIILSTPEIMIDLDKIDLDEYDTTSHMVGRFIYTNSMEESPFTVENYSPVIDEKILKVEAGPFGIKGIKTLEGKLCTYNIEPPSIKGDDNYLIQMDAYIDRPQDIEIVMYTAENGTTKYNSIIHLNGSKGWQRITLKRNDFKNPDRLPLKDWNIVRKMKIKNAEGVLFNNILWI